VVLSQDLSKHIVAASYVYLGRPFIWETFNCFHFVKSVFVDVGIEFPMLDRYGFPPNDFHLSTEEFASMPPGHCVFFKRKTSPVKRYWTHMAIIVGPSELIHCTRHLGNGVTVTPKSEFVELYALAPKSVS
jgi:cell wall-associated NlpC family hydrolase